MSYTRVDFIRCDLIERILDFLLLIKSLIICQFVETFAFINSLHLAKYRLDTVVVWTICQIKYRTDVQESVSVHGIRTSVYSEIVHEDSYWTLAVDIPNPVQKLNVLEPIKSFLLDRKCLDPCFLSNCSTHRNIT